MFTLAVLTLLGGVHAGTASATTRAASTPQTEPSPSPTTGFRERAVQPNQTTQPNQTPDQRPLKPAQTEVELRLEPTKANVGAGEGQDYTATLRARVGRYQFSWNVTRLTGFAVDDPAGSCTKVGGKVSCSATRHGPNTVTGTLPARAFPFVPYQVEGTATLEVTKPDRTPDHLVLDPIEKTIVLGDNATYTARAVDKDNKDLRDVTGQTEFTISLQGQPPTACQGATCTPTKDGDHTVTGRLPLGDRTVEGTAILHVIKPPHHLELQPMEETIQLGRSQTYKAYAVAEDDEVLGEVTEQTRFELTPSGGCQGPTCTPTKAGDHTVTGSLNDQPIVKGTAKLHVRRKQPDHLVLDPVEKTIELGGRVSYTARAFAKNEDLGAATGQTDFTISLQGQPPTACQGATCTPAEVGDYTVTGTLKEEPTVKGAATLHVTSPKPEPDRLRLIPLEKTIQLGSGSGLTYAAHALAKDGQELGEVTGQTDFSISQQGRPSGLCRGATCTPAKEGDHTVTGTLRDQPTVRGTATLHVKRESPSISSVTPSVTAPGKPVEARGTTGSCNHAGTLTLHGTPNEASVNVTGDDHGAFLARFTVPTGTFPKAYRLELTVDCNGQLQQAEGTLTVINLAPIAVDDSATTPQDTPVAIAVTANDRNPDPDTGYQMVVVEHGSPPSNGTIQVQADGAIIYTPRAGFVGRDQFEYGFCDNVINAAGTTDCGIATVIATVNPGTSTTTSGPPGSVPPSSGPSTTSSPCAPSPGDLRQHLQVTPVKGPGGTKLRITATVNRKLAACPLRLLFGGTPLGPDLSVGSDGSIAAQVPVPADAIPGSSIVRLATTGGQVLDQASFEILPTLLRRWWQRDPYRLLLGVGALLTGALARAGLRRLRRLLQEHDQDEDDPARQHGLRAEPYTRPVEVTVEPDTEDRPTLVVRLRPHDDAGALSLQEVPG